MKNMDLTIPLAPAPPRPATLSDLASLSNARSPPPPVTALARPPAVALTGPCAHPVATLSPACTPSHHLLSHHPSVARRPGLIHCTSAAGLVSPSMSASASRMPPRRPALLPSTAIRFRTPPCLRILCLAASASVF
jgi:hypothetical protein